MPIRPTFIYYEGLMPDHAATFAELRQAVSWDERMRARKTASFGLPYNYSGMDYPPAAFPAVLERVRCRVEQAVGWAPNNCLLNLYEDGQAKMGMHADAIEELDPTTAIAIVSLGSTRSLVFEHKASGTRWAYELHPGSMIVMPLSLQGEWRHGIPKCAEGGARVSATFRRICAGR